MTTSPPSAGAATATERPTLRELAETALELADARYDVHSTEEYECANDIFEEAREALFVAIDALTPEPDPGTRTAADAPL